MHHGIEILMYKFLLRCYLISNVGDVRSWSSFEPFNVLVQIINSFRLIMSCFHQISQYSKLIYECTPCSDYSFERVLGSFSRTSLRFLIWMMLNCPFKKVIIKIKIFILLYYHVNNHVRIRSINSSFLPHCPSVWFCDC